MIQCYVQFSSGLISAIRSSDDEALWSLPSSEGENVGEDKIIMWNLNEEYV